MDPDYGEENSRIQIMGKKIDGSILWGRNKGIQIVDKRIDGSGLWGRK